MAGQRLAVGFLQIVPGVFSTGVVTDRLQKKVRPHSLMPAVRWDAWDWWGLRDRLAVALGPFLGAIAGHCRQPGNGIRTVVPLRGTVLWGAASPD